MSPNPLAENDIFLTKPSTLHAGSLPRHATAQWRCGPWQPRPSPQAVADGFTSTKTSGKTGRMVTDTSEMTSAEPVPLFEPLTYKYRYKSAASGGAANRSRVVRQVLSTGKSARA